MIRRVILALAAGAAVAGAQLPSGVQRGVVVTPESVTVGDPFRVVIRVRAPLGTVLDFPDGPDTAFAVEALDRVAVADAGDSTAVEQTATYRLTAWDLGARRLRFPDILATRDGETRRLPVGTDLQVVVQSVLPEDSTQWVPRPPRPVYEFGLPWWWWAAVIAGAAALGALFWWWWRRRPRPVAAQADPHAEARRAFDRIDGLGLVGAGETGQHLTLYVDVLREYLARVRPGARVALTTGELLHALRGDRVVPVSRLARVLHEADLVKFARRRVGSAAAMADATECRALVDEVHARREAPTAPREAA